MERLCRGGAPPRHAVRYGYLSAPRRSENPARRFGLVVRALGQHDVVVADLVLDEALRVGRDLLVADHRVQRREGRNEVEVAALQVPEVSDFIPYNVEPTGARRFCARPGWAPGYVALSFCVHPFAFVGVLRVEPRGIRRCFGKETAIVFVSKHVIVQVGDAPSRQP